MTNRGSTVPAECTLELEKKNALLEERIATLEQEKSASAEMKDKYIEKIKEMKKTEQEMRERIQDLETKKAVWVDQVEQKLTELEKKREREDKESWANFERSEKHIREVDEKLDQLKKYADSICQLTQEKDKQAETIADLQKKARKNHIVKTFLEVKNRSLEHMKSEHEKERESMKKYRLDMIRLLQDRNTLLDEKNEALKECHKEKMKMIDDFHLEVKLIDRLQAFSEKFDSIEPKDYKSELFASLGKLKPGIDDFESTEWIELESQLLVPFLMGKELAKKKNAESEDLYKQIVDHFSLLGLHIDS